LNARRHLAKNRGVSRSATAHLDGASSARWFDGWRPEAASRLQEASGAPEVARPRTWLLRIGWRRHGLVDPSEVPGKTD
jgi:putative transposase